MSSSRQSYESGFRSNSEMSNSDSAMKEFWNSYMPQLEMAVKQNFRDGENLDDPTIDLNHVLGSDIVIRPPSPICHRKNSADIASHRKKKDPTIEELLFVVGEFKKRSNYGNKLADIMLKGLETTLKEDMYRVFLLGRLPSNWMPIAKMNNDNTPYMEFLIKSEIADEDPGSQLNEYTMEHIGYSKVILDYLYDCTKQLKVPAASNSRQLHSHEKQQKSIVSQKKTYTNPPQINTSTPISQRKTAPTKRASLPLDESLNDSKRILPSRACKSGQKRL